MEQRFISDIICYREASEQPLSADVGIIRVGGETWLYDVGNGKPYSEGLDENCRVVLSHFHPDHTGNIGGMKNEKIFVSKETQSHIGKGTVIEDDWFDGCLHIFPIPSSHAKGCLGLEVDSLYAFVGDALYCRVKENCLVYNAQLLKDEIGVLRRLKAPYLLVSHFKGLIRDKEDVLNELLTIYGMRQKDDPEIRIPRQPSE